MKTSANLDALNEALILASELAANGIPGADDEIAAIKAEIAALKGPKVLNEGVEDTAVTENGNHFCRRCAGTGAFITRVENGVPKGPGGQCFRCNGKGFHNHDDRKRNWGYERSGRRVSLA